MPTSLTRDPITGEYSYKDPTTAVVNQTTGQTADTLGPSTQTSPELRDLSIRMAQQNGTEPVSISTVGSDKLVDEKITQPVTQGKTAQQIAQEKMKASQQREPVDPFLQEGETEVERLSRLRDEAFEKRQSQYDQLAVANTELTNAFVADLKRQWNDASEAMKRANQMQQGIYTQAGLRSGAARYSPEHQADLIANKQAEGLRRLADIDSKYQGAINEAQAALASKNYELAFQKAGEAQEYHDKALTEAKTQANEAKKLSDSVNQAMRELQIVDLYQQGITSPEDLLVSLNRDFGGNIVNDISLEEITKVVDALAKERAEPISFEDLGKINQELGTELPVGTTMDDLIGFGLVPSGKNPDLYEFRSVGKDLVRINKETGETNVIFQGRESEDPFTTQQRFSNTFAFRKEITDNSKDFLTARDAMGRIEANAKRSLDEASPAANLALVFNFMKVLDPNSVVRESEFANAARARAEFERVESLGFPVPTIAKQALERMKTGEILTENQVKDFLVTARDNYAPLLESQILLQKDALETAQAFGLDPNKAAPDLTNVKSKYPTPPQGQILVWSITDKKVGHLPVDEYDPNLHITL